MITMIVAAWVAFTPSSPDPGLPTLPPQQPQSIVLDDGTRLTCTPTYTQCWRHDGY